MKLTFSFIFLSLITNNVIAQNAKIVGRIIDAKTNSGVPFAIIFSPDSLLIAETNIDGKFILKHVKPGTYDFVVSCFPYLEDTIIKNIAVSTSGNIKLQIQLRETKITTLDSIVGKTCPICHSDSNVVPIVYGIEYDYFKLHQKKIYPSGCLLMPQKWYCKKDRVKY
jgi:hypothetical protein